MSKIIIYSISIIINSKIILLNFFQHIALWLAYYDTIDVHCSLFVVDYDDVKGKERISN